MNNLTRIWFILGLEKTRKIHLSLNLKLDSQSSFKVDCGVCRAVAPSYLPDELTNLCARLETSGTDELLSAAATAAVSWDKPPCGSLPFLLHEP